MERTKLASEKDYYNESSSVSRLAEIFNQKYSRLWWDTPVGFPFSTAENISRLRKRENRKKTDEFIKKISGEFRNYPEGKEERKLWAENIKAFASDYAKNTIGFTDGFLKILFTEGFVNSTKNFVAKAKEFDAGIKIEDIFQAIRNVWIMNSIQIFLSKEVEFTPSIFAYSMLYPFTDNYLDNPDISLQEKENINKRFEECLAGRPAIPQNTYEKALFELVGMIESQYPRESFHSVFQSLLGIHAAQQTSIMQQDKRCSPYEADILGISAGKGGMSVLTDAYLIKGRLTDFEADFMFGFGVILQLADDLQDVYEDMRNGHMTIFSQTAGKWPLDNITNRLFNFVGRVMEVSEDIDTPVIAEMKKLIRFNCNFLIMQAIAKNKHMYSQKYIKEIGRYSIFEFSYLGKLYSRLRKEYATLNKDQRALSLDDLIADSD